MNPLKSKVRAISACNILVSLSDNSTVEEKLNRNRSLLWKSDHGVNTVLLSDTSVIPEMSMILLSVPEMVNKKIYLLFMTEKTIIFYLENDMKILGDDQQDDDCLFYITDVHENSKSNFSSKERRDATAMMAIEEQ